MNNIQKALHEPMTDGQLDESFARDAQHKQHAFGIRTKVMTEAERLGSGFAPIPVNFISGLQPLPGPQLVECSDNEL